MFKKRLTCFLQQIRVKRQDEVFCQGSQTNNLTDSKEGSFVGDFSVMFRKEKKERKERLGLAPPPPPPVALGGCRGCGNIIPADESLPGLFCIYSSAAEFMIIVLKPWQRALCPGRLCAFVIPSSLSSLSAALRTSLLIREVQILRRGKFSSWQKQKLKFPTTSCPDTGEEACANEKLTCKS